MSVVSLSLFKKHVNADDFTTDDELLQHYLDAAIAAVCSYTNRTEEELLEMGGGSFPVMLTQAVLLWGGLMYDQREGASSASMSAVPFGVAPLLKRYTKLVADDESSTTDDYYVFIEELENE